MKLDDQAVSQNHVEIVRAVWEAYNRGEIDAFLERADPECEFHEDPAFPEAGVYRGPEEIKAYLLQFREAMADHWFEVEEVKDFGGGVISLLHERARGKASGVEVDIRPAFVFRFRDDKINYARAYLNRSEALADVGLDNQ
jgi:ketosteroid isomerase-like protein